uniref:Uncharacterized protein n=1 Tax=Anguilla anguilla TaxID=7936 RepID=A0A0E9RWT3_ANGAN
MLCVLLNTNIMQRVAQLTTDDIRISHSYFACLFTVHCRKKGILILAMGKMKSMHRWVQNSAYGKL